MAHILIVDDEREVRQGLRRALDRREHVVTEASNVAEARQLMAGETFDLLLCDINMPPGDSGLELVQQVRQELPDTAVVMVTGIDRPDVAEQALQLGAYGYLVKPVLPNEVLINVASGLHRRELERARRFHTEELETKVLDRTAELREAVHRLEEREASAQLAEHETIDRLVRALTLRSEETGGHIQRMSRYAMLLSRRRQCELWSDDEIRVAAMLHDVGKIGVPDAVLLKPGDLTEQEFGLVKRHAEMGHRLLADGKSPVLGLAATIALTHHERFDGSGYPTGLKGEEIPLEGRITALADAFDAMTNDRVYRKAYPVEQAIELIQSQRGRQFDPDLIDLFVAAMDEVVAIKSAHPEPDAGLRDVQVLLVDSHRMFADALTRVLTATEGISVVGVAATVAQAMQAVRDRQPDVAVLDQHLGNGEGTEGTEGTEVAALLRAQRPETRVLLLADRDDDQLLLQAFEAGCAGQVIRSRAFEDIVPAVLAAHADQPLIPTTRLASLLRRHDRSGHGTYTALTRREMEVLRLLAAGLSNDAIAERFVLSLNTVRNHVQNILTKLQAHSRLEAVSLAVSQGIIRYP